MFGIFLTTVISYYAADIGSEYVKIAEPTIKGIPKMKFDPNGKNWRAAFAVKRPDLIVNQSITDDVEQFGIRFGTSAASILKHNPFKGFEYIFRALGRFSSSFNTLFDLSGAEAGAIWLQNLVNNYLNKEPLILGVPQYWTGPQRRALSSTMRNAEIPIDSIIEDTEAVSAHYAATKYSTFMDSEKNVLFVDIGATTVKSYGITFKYGEDQISAKQGSYEWSENAGSFFWARDIALLMNTTLSKARKMLARQNSAVYIESLNDSIILLESVISKAAETFRLNLKNASITENSREIDEVQIIGGASRLDFINSLVQNATKCEKILREFNPSEAIAVGLVYLRAMYEGSIPIPKLAFKRYYPRNIKLVADGKTEVTYCTKGVGCVEFINLSLAKCDELALVIDEEDLPEGSWKFEQRLNLLDQKKFKTPLLKTAYGRITLNPDFPEIRNVEWCHVGHEDKCKRINANLAEERPVFNIYSINFTISAISHGEGAWKHKQEMNKLIDFISQIKTQLDTMLDQKGLTEESLPTELYTKFKRYYNAMEDGSLNSKTVGELQDALTDMKISTKYLLEAVGKMKNHKKQQDKDDIFNDLKNEFEEEENKDDDKKEEEEKKDDDKKEEEKKDEEKKEEEKPQEEKKDEEHKEL